MLIVIELLYIKKSYRLLEKIYRDIKKFYRNFNNKNYNKMKNDFVMFAVFVIFETFLSL